MGTGHPQMQQVINSGVQLDDRIDAGQRGLDKTESLALLDSLQSGGRAKAKAHKR